MDRPIAPIADYFAGVPAEDWATFAEGYSDLVVDMVCDAQPDELDELARATADARPADADLQQRRRPARLRTPQALALAT